MQKEKFSETELCKEMISHHVNGTELREDQFWVNDATRKDLQSIAEKNNFDIFGLKCWRDWKVTEAKKLGEAFNFQVDYVFVNSDKAKVDAIIATYEREIAKGYSSKVTWDCVNALAELALMECVWT